MTHIGSSFDGSIGRRMGDLYARCLIISKHRWWRGLHSNAWPFFVMAARGPLYADTSGMKCARY